MPHPRHLTYDSLEAWKEGEGLPEDWIKHPDAHQQNVWWKQYIELKRHLWARHIATLSEQEQKEIGAGSHPSQSHKFRERALPYTEALRSELASLGYAATVRLGIYHCDRIVLSASLDRAPTDGLRGVPWLFRGFEVKYGYPATNEPNAA